jgi:hypothetical protein
MAFAEEMLDLFEECAHPEGGIPHAFFSDMRAAELAPPSAQGMYLTLLDLVRLGGGDWKKHYPFAKRIARSILQTEVEETGLCLGYSLFPDYRELIGETGRDLSAFNNTVTYCAVRSMACLAREAGDGDFARVLSDFADRTRANFDRLFYNPALGFLDSSLDAETKEGRGILSVNSVKWENSFCADLIAGREAEYLRTVEEKLLSPAGLRPMAEDCPCYDGDANQLHCWWPVMSELYARLIHRAGRGDLILGYLGFAEYWSERLCCPEGIPTYDNDPDVPFDRWNAAPGIWHGYSVRGFYNAILHAYVGVDVDGEGLHLAPVTEDAVSLTGLHFGKYTFDIEIEAGRGGEVILDGRSLGNVTLIPFSLLDGRHTVVLKRQ